MKSKSLTKEMPFLNWAYIKAGIRPQWQTRKQRRLAAQQKRQRPYRRN